MTIDRLGKDDVEAARALNALFARVFDMADDYLGHPPNDAYLARVLSDEGVIALVAREEGEIVGGLTAYAMPKLEQARAEYYIYDLAVISTHRRRGIATVLIKKACAIAKAAGAWSVMIQADEGDAVPIALYSKFGRREDVHHFDIRP